MKFAGFRGRYLPYELPNGHQVAYALGSGEADVMAVPMWIKLERLANVTFTLPFIYQHLGYYLIETGLHRFLKRAKRV